MSGCGADWQCREIYCRYFCCGDGADLLGLMVLRTAIVVVTWMTVTNGTNKLGWRFSVLIVVSLPTPL